MNPRHFQTLQPRIDNNPKLRIPQLEGYDAVATHFQSEEAEREAGIVLPVGCGKSGLITLVPFAVKARKALVIAPGVRIAKQLYDDFDPSNSKMFYQKCEVLIDPPFPELAEMRGTKANRDDLDHADVIVTNIHQIQGATNLWLNSLPDDYFDVILFDEAHHNVAESWEVLRSKFPGAKILNFSATPTRADGGLMAGKIIYSFPIFRAMGKGYIKRIKAVVLNPRTLRYVRSEDGQELSISLPEVKKLAEEDSEFRRSIVSSKETLDTIADASIRELQKLRKKTGDNRIKIIASALNQDHCIQVVRAYRERSMRVDYIHTNVDGKTNKKVLENLDNHELDVIVQVRMLGEGYDHPYLSVAAVFSVFGHLSPFAQFVGRIMRVINQNAPKDPLNQGTVVFHAGSNVAKVWSDFQAFSEADQEFFEQLLPTEQWHYGDDNDEHEVEIEIPGEAEEKDSIEIRGQDGVSLEEIPLLERDPSARELLRGLFESGLTLEQVAKFENELKRVPTNRYQQKLAARSALDDQIRNAAGRILRERNVSPEGKKLDRRRLGRTNFVVLKSAIDDAVNERVGFKAGERHEFTLDQFNLINSEFLNILTLAAQGVFDGKGEGSS